MTHTPPRRDSSGRFIERQAVADTPLTDADLNAIESRANAAPADEMTVETAPCEDNTLLRRADGETVPSGCGEWENCAAMPLALATFWATARPDVFRLVAEVRRLRSLLKERRR